MCVFHREGVLVKCEIYGEVLVNSHLSGVPDLTLSFTNPSILDDVRFHPCVRFRPWESHQILSFIPPDGLFKLMSYRLKKCFLGTLVLFLSIFILNQVFFFVIRVKKLKATPIYLKPQLTSESGSCRISVMLGVRNDPGKTIDSVTVKFQLPPCVLSADLSSNCGTVNVLTNKV